MQWNTLRFLLLAIRRTGLRNKSKSYFPVACNVRAKSVVTSKSAGHACTLRHSMALVLLKSSNADWKPSDLRSRVRYWTKHFKSRCTLWLYGVSATGRSICRSCSFSGDSSRSLELYRSSRLCASTSSSDLAISRAAPLALKAAYFVYLLQKQWTNSSPLVLDVYLTELVAVLSDTADFSHGILITHPVEELVDPPRGRLLKHVVWVDVDYFTVPGKVCWWVRRHGDREGKGIGRTPSTGVPFYSFGILWSPHRDM